MDQHNPLSLIIQNAIGACQGKKRWVCLKIGTAHKMRKVFGKPEVSKALGFAAHGVLRAQIMFRATGYNGRVSMNPLYPTYKTWSPSNNQPTEQRHRSFFLVTFWLPRDANGCPFHACRCISTKVTIGNRQHRLTRQLTIFHCFALLIFTCEKKEQHLTMPLRSLINHWCWFEICVLMGMESLCRD